MSGAVVVVGLGLIGGSVARGLAAAGRRVIGLSPDAADRAGAGAVAGIEASAEAGPALAGASLVVYAAPLGTVLDLLPAHAPMLSDSAVLTDVCGLKLPILAAARAAGLGERFVGSHPMAGSERSGFAASRAGLFEGARVWLCADEAGAGARATVAGLWSGLGACPSWIDPAAHDRLMVRASHLPQLVSNALALALEDAGVRPDELGPGGRDATRLAGSAPHQWADLLARTGPELAALLRSVEGRASELAGHLERSDAAAVAELMARTRAWRTGAEGGGAEPS